MGTYADDTAILVSDPYSLVCTRRLQNHLNTLSEWCYMWKIKVNELKSTHITFTLRPKDCHEVSFNIRLIPHSTEAKNLGVILDRRLTWGPHLKSKRKQHDYRLQLIRTLLKSNMTISNRLLL